MAALPLLCEEWMKRIRAAAGPEDGVLVQEAEETIQLCRAYLRCILKLEIMMTTLEDDMHKNKKTIRITEIKSRFNVSFSPETTNLVATNVEASLRNFIRVVRDACNVLQCEEEAEGMREDHWVGAERVVGSTPSLLWQVLQDADMSDGAVQARLEEALEVIWHEHALPAIETEKAILFEQKERLLVLEELWKRARRKLVPLRKKAERGDDEARGLLFQEAKTMHSTFRKKVGSALERLKQTRRLASCLQTCNLVGKPRACEGLLGLYGLATAASAEKKTDELPSLHGIMQAECADEKTCADLLLWFSTWLGAAEQLTRVEAEIIDAVRRQKDDSVLWSGVDVAVDAVDTSGRICLQAPSYMGVFPVGRVCVGSVPRPEGSAFFSTPAVRICSVLRHLVSKRLLLVGHINCIQARKFADAEADRYKTALGRMVKNILVVTGNAMGEPFDPAWIPSEPIVLKSPTLEQLAVALDHTLRLTRRVRPSTRSERPALDLLSVPAAIPSGIGMLACRAPAEHRFDYAVVAWAADAVNRAYVERRMEARVRIEKCAIPHILSKCPPNSHPKPGGVVQRTAKVLKQLCVCVATARRAAFEAGVVVGLHAHYEMSQSAKANCHQLRVTGERDSDAARLLFVGLCMRVLAWMDSDKPLPLGVEWPVAERTKRRLQAAPQSRC